MNNNLIEMANTIPNIPIVGQFEKISFEQYKKDVLTLYGLPIPTSEIQESYDNIKLPKRATSGSAGYDFFSPDNIMVRSSGGMVIPTGIRCKILPGWVLKLYPRSSHGFNYGMYLYNTIGIIDSDYYNAENEGHIMVKMSVREPYYKIKEGEKFCQGIFEQYGITVEDSKPIKIRTGGFGSTDKK